MKKIFNKKFLLSLFVILLSVCFISEVYSKDKSEKIKTQKPKDDAQIVSNDLFSIELPADTKGLYGVIKKENGIFIYDKVSKKSGFGGFAFGIKAYERPSDYAMMPGGKKLGELIDKNSTLYDIILIQPTDVQFNYVTGESKTYDILYDLADTVGNNIHGIKGSTYHDKQGTLGKDLYKEVLRKHIAAIKDKWDSYKLEKNNMSYMYNVMALAKRNVLEETGYAYYDVNGDGIDELFIGEIADGEWKGIVYDIYTMVNRKPVHVASGGSRNRYYVCNDAFICNEYSGGANENGVRVYILVENSTELFPQFAVKYDAYENKDKPWFITYDLKEDEGWENVSEDKYNERLKPFKKYKRFDYIPFQKPRKEP